MNKDNIEDIDERTFKFAVRVIKMSLQLPHNPASWKLSGQVIDSSTSINSNIVHARAGISRNDFINHFRISLKEAKETKRWLEMIVAVGLMPLARMELLLQENEEIICILVTIVKNATKDKK